MTRYPNRVWLDAEPLRHLITRGSGAGAGGWPHDDGYSRMGGITAELSPALERAYHRAMHDGRITIYQADRICMALGRHPTELYGLAFYEGTEGTG